MLSHFIPGSHSRHFYCFIVNRETADQTSFKKIKRSERRSHTRISWNNKSMMRDRVVIDKRPVRFDSGLLIDRYDDG